MSPTLAFSIEIISVIFSLLYVFLLTRENIGCWLFGILSSTLNIALFLDAKLYSESILSLFYVLIGIYGWYVWNKKVEETAIPIKQWNISTHINLLFIGVLGTLSLGWVMARQGAASPYIDAATTAFSFMASYMQAHKILSNWVFWIIINAISVWLYYSRGLQVYAGLMILYTGLSVWGLMEWKKQLQRD